MKSLTTFYRDLQAWIDEGCPIGNDYGFRTYRGLCVNLGRWCLTPKISDEESYILEKELEYQFVCAGLDPWYPFNEGNRISFRTECENWTIFQNPERLQWIKNHCND